MAILLPLIGAIPLAWQRDADDARKWCFVYAGLSFLCAFSAWQDFGLLHAHEADDKWHLMTLAIGRELFMIDTLSAPLLPWARCCMCWCRSRRCGRNCGGSVSHRR